ncbi:MAG: RNA polymerase factor sigma-32 [Bacteriovoracaceae bacterium]|nr:RNA polymerase factor sigma-32 [Bacteriovoracaceae bacterium]
MAKKIKDTDIPPEIIATTKKSEKRNKEDVIEVDIVADESLLPKMVESLPVLKQSTSLKVQDPLTLYLKEISRHKLLTPEEEKELTAELLRTGDIEVARKLVLANLRLVVKIALEYKNAYKNIMDLIQEGNIGLMKAVSKYDPSKGAKLSYYASWWIRSYILKFILDNFRLVKIGTTQEQKKLFYNLLREKQRLLSQGINPDVKLLSSNLGVSEKAVLEMDQRLSSHGQEVSLDKPLDEDGGRHTLGDVIGDDQESLENKLADLQNLEILKEQLGDFVKGLKPRDQEIFKKRLLSEIPESLQSIADQYGVSRERIRQVEERLIEQLKIYMSEFLR